MQQIEIIDAVQLHTGNIELTDKQAKPRRHLLEPVLDDGDKPIKHKVGNEVVGEYVIKDTVTFKAGEVFGYDGEIKVISNKARDFESGKLLSDIILERKIKKRLTEQEAKKSATKDVDEQNVKDILAVIDDLNPETDYTEGGKPEVEAIKVLLERNITAAERDAAWFEFKKG